MRVDWQNQDSPPPLPIGTYVSTPWRPDAANRTWSLEWKTTEDIALGCRGWVIDETGRVKIDQSFMEVSFIDDFTPGWMVEVPLDLDSDYTID